MTKTSSMNTVKRKAVLNFNEKIMSSKISEKMAGTVFDLMVFEETHHTLEDENDVLATFFKQKF